MKTNQGFSLIEIIIVIAIVGIIIAITIVTFKPAEILANSRNAKRVSDIAALNSALGHWLSREGSQQSDPYSVLGLTEAGIGAITPSDGDISGEGVDATSVSELNLPAYIQIIPTDPDGTTAYRIGVDDIADPQHVLVCSDQIEFTSTYPESDYPEHIFCQSN
ncbi:MAG: prepilin-type N-terminal cleavage/methylation domain-containing protein [Candidatus Dojkabacteria bacterium]|nr:prepilin-type N-terminal cleavage/methylation domain-containing protein [Candidatus Dojkabacteria bacterium]